MNIQTALDSVLTNNQRGVAVIPTEHGTASIDVSQSNALACELNAIAFSPHGQEYSSPDRLKSAADELVLKLRYLSEPLALIECDAEALAAQLRSSPPKQNEDDNKITYFECMVQPSEVAVERIERSEDGSRQKIPFKLTREMLLQVIEDIDGTFRLSAKP
jgi:hypothetical protein